MSWINIGLIVSNDWQYTQPFVGDYVRLRYLFGVDKKNLPYGFTGLMGQAFGFPENIELYSITQIYPWNEHDVFKVVNPFPGRERRLAIRGQKRYQTAISWQIFVDVWTSNTSDSDNTIEATVNQILAEIQGDSVPALPVNQTNSFYSDNDFI